MACGGLSSGTLRVEATLQLRQWASATAGANPRSGKRTRIDAQLSLAIELACDAETGAAEQPPGLAARHDKRVGVGQHANLVERRGKPTLPRDARIGGACVVVCAVALGPALRAPRARARARAQARVQFGVARFGSFVFQCAPLHRESEPEQSESC